MDENGDILEDENARYDEETANITSLLSMSDINTESYWWIPLLSKRLREQLNEF